MRTDQQFADTQRAVRAAYFDRYAKEADHLAASYERSGSTEHAELERARAEKYRAEAAAIRAGK